MVPEKPTSLLISHYVPVSSKPADWAIVQTHKPKTSTYRLIRIPGWMVLSLFCLMFIFLAATFVLVQQQQTHIIVAFFGAVLFLLLTMMVLLFCAIPLASLLAPFLIDSAARRDFCRKNS
jgi:hypothetical protein